MLLLLYNHLFAEDHQFTLVVLLKVFFLTSKGDRRKEKITIRFVSATEDFSVSDLFPVLAAKDKF